MSILKYGLAVVGVVGIVGSVPYIVKNSIDNNLTKKQIELKDNGISLDFSKNESYITINRELSLKFTNEEKVLKYILANSDIDEVFLRQVTLNGKLLKEITFKGIVKNDNIISQNLSKVILSFDKLPHSLEKAIEKNIELKKAIKDFKLNMLIDRDGKILSLSSTDIYLKDNKTEIKLLNPKVILEDSGSKTTISHISFKENYISYKSDNNTITNKNIVKDNNINLIFGVDTSNVELYMNNIKTTLDSFSLNSNINNLKNDTTKEFVLNINNEQKLQEIINYGLSIKLDANLKNLKNNMGKIKTIDLDLNIDISKNNISNVDELLKYLSVDGVLTLDNDTVAAIGMLGVPISVYNTNIDVPNNLSIFNIKYLNNKLLINKKEFQ